MHQIASDANLATTIIQTFLRPGDNKCAVTIVECKLGAAHTHEERLAQRHSGFSAGDPGSILGMASQFPTYVTIGGSLVTGLESAP